MRKGRSGRTLVAAARCVAAQAVATLQDGIFHVQMCVTGHQESMAA